MPTYLKLLLAYVPTWLRALIFHVPTCLRAYVRLCILFHAYLPSCLKLFRAYLHLFLTYLRACNHSQNILKLFSIPCIAVFLWIIWPFIHLKPQNKLLLLKLHISILSYGVLLFQLVHVQKQYCEDSLRSYLKQWTLCSILNS